MRGGGGVRRPLGELTPDECDLGQTQFARAPIEAELEGPFGRGQQGELLGSIGRCDGGGVGVLSHGGMMQEGCGTVVVECRDRHVQPSCLVTRAPDSRVVYGR
jgi:hypothetical protein